MAHTFLPPLAPFPPATVRNLLQNEEWGACLDAWIALIELRLKIPQDEFQSSAPKDDSALVFLASFFQEAAIRDGLYPDTKLNNLRRLCFLLTKRQLLEVHPPAAELLDWGFLASFCQAYISSPAIKSLLKQLWDLESQALTINLEKVKLLVMNELLSSKAAEGVTRQRADAHLRSLTVLALAVPSAGHVLMTGSDYIDTLFDAYRNNHKINATLQKTIVANAYVAFASLLKLNPPATSLLLDQLFSLKAAAKVDAKGTKKEPTLLSDIICSTNLLGKMEAVFSDTSQKRGHNLVTSLRAYQTECVTFHSRYQRTKRRKDKGKDRADDEMNTHDHAQDIHIHKMALITQVQDLFPHLGTGYIARLLDHYGDSVEAIISHLLEDSLAPQLRGLDLSEELQQPNHGTPATHNHLAPKPTPPLSPSLPPLQPQLPSSIPQRKNIFDNADLTRDTIAPKSLHYGRANAHQTADDLLSQKPTTSSKAAILSALAAFDSDDDERDDTYDMADVGGTVDAVLPGTDVDTDTDIRMASQHLRPVHPPSSRTHSAIDHTLYSHYTSTPALFGRDAATRRSAPRAKLREETGMTDEAIEGWAVMLTRDPERMARMERSFALGGGGANRQPDLPATAYRRREGLESGTGTESEETDEGGSGRGRGRGRGRRGFGGGVAHGPHPRDFSTGLPKKIYDLAWRTALSYRYRRGQLIIVNDNITFPREVSPYWLTDVFEKNQWGKGFGRSLMITEVKKERLFKAVAQIGQHARVLDREDVDVKDLLETGRLIVEKTALDRMLFRHSRDLKSRPARA
ncbi:hypothetical protein ACJ72_00152 [Emergomyces africanus]|uniref:CUE domain-containing protein n=1 Tax=Emergomyces africanus TaxID=1955775 RepID=A0A1B7P8Z6_9EURO|nr:hypothetical protein ACJ72_00152 [Emergomyces africanus]